MKKIVALTLTLAMAFSMVACGAKTEEAPATPTISEGNIPPVQDSAADIISFLLSKSSTNCSNVVKQITSVALIIIYHISFISASDSIYYCKNVFLRIIYYLK